MTIYICKSLISHPFCSSSRLYQSHLSFSISTVFFSSSRADTSKAASAVADFLVSRYKFSVEIASKVSSALKYPKNPEKYEPVLTFLKESGFSNAHLERVAKIMPRILTAKLESTIKPKIKIFLDFGFSPADIGEIVSSCPFVLTRSADNRLAPSILTLESIMGSKADVVKVLKISGWFFEHDLEKNMLPNIEFLKSCGIAIPQIKRFMFNFPRFFLQRTVSIEGYVKKVDKLGVNRDSKMFLYAIRTLSSMTAENWELKLQLFRDLGFSEDAILSMFRRAPQVFAVSQKKIKAVMEILRCTVKADTSFVANRPEILILSIEKRLKPRLRILVILEGKKLLPKMPSLASACRISDKQFFDKFVLPYSKDE